MAYLVETDLEAYGFTSDQVANGMALIPAATRLIDAHVMFPFNPDGFKFPRVRQDSLAIMGDFQGSAKLAGNITSGTTNFNLTGFSGYPNGALLLQLGVGFTGEIINATFNNTTGAVTVVNRGYFNTTAVAWSQGTTVQYGVVPTNVKNAALEQILWMMQQSPEFVVGGGDDALSGSTLGAGKSRARVSMPMLAPLAKLHLKPYLQRVGYIQGSPNS